MKHDEMKQRALPLLQRAIVLFLLLALLAACVPQRPNMAPAETTAVAVEGAVETPATTGSASPVVTAGATATVVTAVTSSPAEQSTTTSTPVPPTPWQETRLPVLGSVEKPPATGCVIYQNGRVADAQLPIVYSGRDTSSGILGQLGRNHWANGLQVQNGWFEIVVGVGQTGWVQETGVGHNGHCGSDSDPLSPILGSLDSLPATGCIVYQNGQVRDEDLPVVRSGPDAHSEILGRLGRERWANGLQVQDGWFEIIIGPGETGWVQENGVGVHGECNTGPGQTVPVIMNRGAPSNYRCVAMRPGNSLEPPPIYQGANSQSAVIARLGNWADVRELDRSWYQLALPTGGNGWVPAGQVELNMGCGTSGPIRIEFPAGATGTTVEGKVPAQTRVTYLFWAAAEQELETSVSSPENSFLFHIDGVKDGQVLKDLLDGESTWQGTVPTSQDYRLTLDNAGEMATYTIQLAIRD